MLYPLSYGRRCCPRGSPGATTDNHTAPTGRQEIGRQPAPVACGSARPRPTPGPGRSVGEADAGEKVRHLGVPPPEPTVGLHRLDGAAPPEELAAEART